MVKLAGTFSHFHPFTALVIGDFLLDAYTTGKVRRISPEAPVPVMEVIKRESRPGGAGNVVLNFLALGASVLAAGRIGPDSEGEELKQRLDDAGADTRGLFVEPRYRTPVKNRLIADSQQLLRVDFETIAFLDPSLEPLVCLRLESLIAQAKVVAISDYGKGFLTPSIIAYAITAAKRHKIPVVVDPKGIDFAKYRGATVLKPNLGEAYAAAKMAPSAPLEEVAKHILALSLAETLLITRSEAGISVFDKECRREDFPVRSKEVKDVTGAGDTVLAMIGLALANGLDISQAAQLANIAAGLAIEKVGCVQVTLAELAERLLEYDADAKVFEESHAYALSEVLKAKKSYSLLLLERDQPIESALFRAIRRLAAAQTLTIYVRGADPTDELVHLLSSLSEVHSIILHAEGLEHVRKAVPPCGVFALEGGEIRELVTAISRGS